MGKWKLYGLIGVGVTVLSGVLYLWGYMKGSSSTRLEMTEEMNQALASQMERMQETHQSDLVAVARKISREASNAKRIDEIQRPTGDCRSDDWLRAFNDGVRAANPDTNPANGTFIPFKRG